MSIRMCIIALAHNLVGNCGSLAKRRRHLHSSQFAMLYCPDQVSAFSRYDRDVVRGKKLVREAGSDEVSLLSCPAEVGLAQSPFGRDPGQSTEPFGGSTGFPGHWHLLGHSCTASMLM